MVVLFTEHLPTMLKSAFVAVLVTIQSLTLQFVFLVLAAAKTVLLLDHATFALMEVNWSTEFALTAVSTAPCVLPLVAPPVLRTTVLTQLVFANFALKVVQFARIQLVALFVLTAGEESRIEMPITTSALTMTME